MIHVGADVHVRNTYYHVTDEKGQPLIRGRCGNTLMETGQFMAPLELRAKASGEMIHVVLESTTNSRPMKRLLETYGEAAGIDLTAKVLDARKVKMIAESVSKSDKVDSRILNEMSRSNLRLPESYTPDDEEFALREHLRARTDLVRMRTMLKNRVHAIFHRRGILTPSGDLFAKAGRVFMAQAPLDEPGRELLSRFLETMDRIQSAIDESSASLRQLMRQPRWSRPAALLQTMPGIGPLTALTILSELGDVSRFRSRAAIANYAGLIPKSRRSDGTARYGSITRRGPSHLRRMLIEAAWVSFAKVPAYQSLFERVERTGCRRKAVVAVARRMLEDAYVMLKKDEPFRYVAPPKPTLVVFRREATPRREDPAALGSSPAAAASHRALQAEVPRA